MTLMSLVTLSTLLIFTSCNKEEAGDSQFSATMESCTDIQGKTVLNGTNLNWVSGDQIAIYGTGGNGIYSATPQTPATTAAFTRVSGNSVSAPCRAYYPATLTTDGMNITLPATQTYVAGSMQEFPMYAESNTNTLAFRNLCGALKLHLTKANTSISSIAVTTATPINGTFTVNYNNGDPVLTPVSSSATSVTGTTIVLTCATAQAIDNGADFFIYLPAGNYTGLEIAITDDNNVTCTKTASVTIPVTRSQYTTISLGENDLDFSTVESGDEGALSGLFTVGVVNGDTIKVRFSQGNLQYQASTTTWRFAENQYDYVGADNSNISATYSGWIDLFGWGTGTNPTLASTNNSDYGTFADWGSNAISNGGNTANSGWRTLSENEWRYLIRRRANNTNLGTANARYAKGKVNNVYGLILFPDGYTHPAGVTVPTGINNYGTGWNDYSYTLSQWTEMEAAGAVFLPMANSRTGTSYHYFVDHSSCYWSSSSYLENYAMLLLFNDANCNLNATQRYYGVSVRLVRDND